MRYFNLERTRSNGPGRPHASPSGLIVALTVLLTATAALANRIPVGDARMDPQFIEPYVARFDLEVENADGGMSPNGYWTDSVTFIERGGKRLMRREVAKFKLDGERDMWRVHLVDAETLAPVLTHHRDGSGLTNVQQLDYAGPKVTATVMQGSEQPVIHISRDLEQAPFDLAIWATLLMSLPREAGFTAEIPVVGPGLALAWETVTVHGEETVTLQNGRSMAAWRISTNMRPWTAWITTGAPYLVKALQKLPDGTRQVSWLHEQAR